MREICAKSNRSKPGLVLTTESDYIEVLTSMLKIAKRSVDLCAFSFVTGGSGTLYFRSLPFAVMTRLKALRKSGVEIRIFLEGKRDTAEKNKFTAEHLKKGKIDVRLGSVHAKMVIVDGRYTLLGSSNLTDQSLKKNYETNVLLDSKAVATQATKYFAHLWEGGRHGAIHLRQPLLADGEFKARIVKEIGRAKKSIDFAIYFFNQREIEAALIAAFERGVEILGLLHTHRSFGGSDLKKNHATMARLKKAGISGVRYSPDSTFMHSKYIVIDRKLTLLGSGNWLDRDVTTHPQIYCEIKNRKFCVTLSQHLKRQIEELS